MSPSDRPRACSRTTYSATTSSAFVRVKRNENGDLMMSRTRATAGDCTCVSREPTRILDLVKSVHSAGVHVERVMEGRDDTGREERIVVWIERREGAVWAVGRSVNQHLRAAPEPHEEDYVFVGYELDDAIGAANTTLEDDVVVSEGDGLNGKVRPFRREELLEPLERLFFGR